MFFDVWKICKCKKSENKTRIFFSPKTADFLFRIIPPSGRNKISKHMAHPTFPDCAKSIWNLIGICHEKIVATFWSPLSNLYVSFPLLSSWDCKLDRGTLQLNIYAPTISIRTRIFQLPLWKDGSFVSPPPTPTQRASELWTGVSYGPKRRFTCLVNSRAMATCM